MHNIVLQVVASPLKPLEHNAIRELIESKVTKSNMILYFTSKSLHRRRLHRCCRIPYGRRQVQHSRTYGWPLPSRTRLSTHFTNRAYLSSAALPIIKPEDTSNGGCGQEFQRRIVGSRMGQRRGDHAED